jgi:hypothetical protein
MDITRIQLLELIYASIIVWTAYRLFRGRQWTGAERFIATYGSFSAVGRLMVYHHPSGAPPVPGSTLANPVMIAVVFGSVAAMIIVTIIRLVLNPGADRDLATHIDAFANGIVGWMGGRIAAARAWGRARIDATTAWFVAHTRRRDGIAPVK